MNMDLTRNIVDYVKRLWSQPAQELNQGQRALKYMLTLARFCAAELRQNKARQMAAALTYHTLFSLLPMVALILVVLHSFVDEQQRDWFKDAAVNMVLRPLQQNDAQPTDPEDAAELAAARAEFEQARKQIGDNVQKVMDGLEKINFGSIGVVGVLLFVYAATGLLVQIEQSFNSVFDVTHGRVWYMRLPLYYTMITLGPLVILAGQWMQQRFLQLLAAVTYLKWAVGILVLLSPLLTTWLVLLAMFLMIPATRVSLRAAAIGSFVSAVGWVIGIELFAMYVRTAAIANLYGALALLPLFLLWLWVTWLVVLFGLELTYTLQHLSILESRHQSRLAADQQAVIDAAWIVPVASAIAVRFRQGKPCTLSDLTGKLNLPTRAVTAMLKALREAGLVHQVAEGETDAYTLSRPAETILLKDVLDAADDLMPPANRSDEQQHAWQLVHDLHDAQRSTAGQTTLAAVCDGDGSPGRASRK